MERLRKIFTYVVLFSAFTGLSILASCQGSSNKQKAPAEGNAQTSQKDNSNPAGTANTPPVVAGQGQQPQVSGTINPSSKDQNLNKQSAKTSATANTMMLNNFAKNSDPAPAPVPGGNMSPEMKKAHEYYLSGAKKAVDGDQQGAIEDFTQSLNIFKTPLLFLKRGFSELVLKDYGGALNDMNEALKMNPNMSRAFFGRGVCRFEMKDFTTAEEDFRTFIDKDKTEPMAFNYLAGCRFMQQDFRGALENYDKVVNLDPKYPDIYTNRGMMKHYLNDLKGAVEDYNKALEINPENATAYNNRGGAKLNQQNFKGALEDFNKAISLKKDYADAYDNRAKAKINLNDKEGACADWQKAYSLGMEESRDMILKYCGKLK